MRQRVPQISHFSSKRPYRTHWGLTEALPPKAIWQATLIEVQELTLEALMACQPVVGCQSWAEVPFGGERVKHEEGPNSPSRRPWDPQTLVQPAGNRHPHQGLH